jgi:hypothetical protein
MHNYPKTPAQRATDEQLQQWEREHDEQSLGEAEEEGHGSDDDRDRDDSNGQIEPEKDDYLDRFVTLTAKHHHAVSGLLGNIIGAATQRLAREKGQSRGTPESRELEKCLRRTGTPQAHWKSYIDEPTNAVRVQALEVEGACIMAMAHALELDLGTTVRVLDAYGGDIHDGEYPTSSFRRWYRSWLEPEEEAAE